MKKLFTTLFLFLLFFASAQVGVDTSTPQHMMHVNGSLQLTGHLSVGGDAETKGDPGIAGQILISKGSGKAPEWSDFTVPDISFSTVGTVIAIDGNFVIAQEITVQLSQDYNFTAVNTATAIPNLSTVIVDNEKLYNSSATGNSFTVKQDGVYLVTLNFLLTGARKNSIPAVGIWDDTDNQWIARINDTFVSTGAQMYTLISAANFVDDHVYSFRAGNTAPFTIKSTSSGTTGEGMVSTVTVKRLK